MPETKPKTNKEISIDESEKSLNKEKEELLKDIYVVANDNSGFYQDRASNVIAKFSSLLIILFKEADQSTKENIKMQRSITDLTRKLYFLTIALFFIALLQVVLPFFQHPAEIKCQIQKEENNKTLQKEANPMTKTHTAPMSNK